MAAEKTPVLIGNDPTTGLAVYRRFNNFRADRKLQKITVMYDEFFLVNGNAVEVKPNKTYIVQNTPAQMDGEDIVVPAFNGFDNWFGYTFGAQHNGLTLAQVIETAIDTSLQSLPIGVASGHIMTA